MLVQFGSLTCGFLTLLLDGSLLLLELSLALDSILAYRLGCCLLLGSLLLCLSREWHTEYECQKQYDVIFIHYSTEL